MKAELLEKFIKSGKIASEIKGYALGLLKEGAKALDIAKSMEGKIAELGGKPAFPVNIAINEVAAHYTPKFNDAKVLKQGDLVKLDFGVHVDGCSTDAAFSVSIGDSDENRRLIAASVEAFGAALLKARPGIKVSEIGSEIEAVSKKRGFNVIRNLTGHGIGLFDLHSSPSIPNFNNNDATELKDQTIIALEPFISSGGMFVKETEESEIYQFKKEGSIRDKEILLFIKQEYKGLPFAKRWIIDKFGVLRTTNALREASGRGILHRYKILKEPSGAKIAQTEHTILIKEKPKILTG